MSDADLAAKFSDMIGIDRLGGPERGAVEDLAGRIMEAIDGIADIDLSALTRPLGDLAARLRPQRPAT